MGRGYSATSEGGGGILGFLTTFTPPGPALHLKRMETNKTKSVSNVAAIEGRSVLPICTTRIRSYIILRVFTGVPFQRGGGGVVLNPQLYPRIMALPPVMIHDPSWHVTLPRPKAEYWVVIGGNHLLSNAGITYVINTCLPHRRFTVPS